MERTERGRTKRLELKLLGGSIAGRRKRLARYSCVGMTATLLSKTAISRRATLNTSRSSQRHEYLALHFRPAPHVRAGKTGWCLQVRRRLCPARRTGLQKHKTSHASPLCSCGAGDSLLSFAPFAGQLSLSIEHH